MKEILRIWLSAWQNKDYQTMLEYSQISWAKTEYWTKKSTYSIPEKYDIIDYLTALYKDVTLIEFEVNDERSVMYNDGTLNPNVIVDIAFMCKARYEQINKVKTEIRLARLVKENSDGIPDPKKGIWGVNPNSALRKSRW